MLQLDAVQLIQHSAQPLVYALATVLRKELHGGAHAARRVSWELSRHARQVRRRGRHVERRVRNTEQVSAKHVRHLRLHEIKELLRWREDAFGPTIKQGIVCSLKRAPQEALMISILT